MNLVCLFISIVLNVTFFVNVYRQMVQLGVPSFLYSLTAAVGRSLHDVLLDEPSFLYSLTAKV